MLVRSGWGWGCGSPRAQSLALSRTFQAPGGLSGKWLTLFTESRPPGPAAPLALPVHGITVRQKSLSCCQWSPGPTSQNIASIQGLVHIPHLRPTWILLYILGPRKLFSQDPENYSLLKHWQASWYQIMIVRPSVFFFIAWAASKLSTRFRQWPWVRQHKPRWLPCSLSPYYYMLLTLLFLHLTFYFRYTFNF